MLFLLICFLLALKPSHSFVDFFLDSNETNHLVGYPSTLFYVYNGELRKSSISYTLDIPDYKESVEFTWKTSGSLNKNVNYRFDFKRADGSIILPDSSISLNGSVPNQLSKFSISPHCDQLLNVTANKNRSDFIDLMFNVYLKLDHATFNKLYGEVQPPSLNFSISLRKSCSRYSKPFTMVSIRKASDFKIAYFIIGSMSGCLVFLVIAMSVLRLKDKYLSAKKQRGQEKIYSSKNANAAIYGQKTVSERSHRSNTTNTGATRSNRIEDRAQTNVKPLKLKLKKQRVDDYESSKSQQRVDNSSKSQSTNNKMEVDNLYESVRELSTIHYPNEVHGQTFLNKSQKMDATTYTLEITRDKTNLLDSSRLSLNTIINGCSSSKQVALIDGFLTEVDDYEAVLDENCRPLPDDKSQRFQVELGELILNGSYGCVYEGVMCELVSKRQTSSSNMNQRESAENVIKKTKILIKTTNSEANLEHKRSLVKDAMLLKGLKHKNLNPLITISLDQQDLRPMAIFLNCGLRNLKIHLNQIAKSNEQEKENPLSLREILYMLLQLIKGVNFLHGKRIIHGDISTRNCWIDNGFYVKISDSALSKDLFPDDYCCLENSQEVRPIRWMPIETIANLNESDINSDIWSCGVTIWECFTCASQPYENLKASEILDFLTKSERNRLKRTQHCPVELYDLYRKCWRSDPNHRPKLKRLFYAFHQFYVNLEKNF